MSEFMTAYQIDLMSKAMEDLEQSMRLKNTPFAIYQPRIVKDGNAWICILGSDLQTGVCGVGDSPEECAADFNKAWVKKEGPR